MLAKPGRCAGSCAQQSLYSMRVGSSAFVSWQTSLLRLLRFLRMPWAHALGSCIKSGARKPQQPPT